MVTLEEILLDLERVDLLRTVPWEQLVRCAGHDLQLREGHGEPPWWVGPLVPR